MMTFSIRPRLGQAGINSVVVHFQIGMITATCTNADSCAMNVIEFFKLEAVTNDETNIQIFMKVNNGSPRSFGPVVIPNASFLRPIFKVKDRSTTFSEPKIMASLGNANPGEYAIIQTEDKFVRICAASNRTVWLRNTSGSRFYVNPKSELAKINC